MHQDPSGNNDLRARLRHTGGQPNNNPSSSSASYVTTTTTRSHVQLGRYDAKDAGRQYSQTLPPIRPQTPERQMTPGIASSSGHAPQHAPQHSRLNTANLSLSIDSCRTSQQRAASPRLATSPSLVVEAHAVAPPSPGRPCSSPMSSESPPLKYNLSGDNLGSSHGSTTTSSLNNSLRSMQNNGVALSPRPRSRQVLVALMIIIIIFQRATL